MSDVQARAAEKVEVALRSVGIHPERWVPAKIAAVLAEAGLLSEHRVNGLATWRELCEKAEDERDAARAERDKWQRVAIEATAARDQQQEAKDKASAKLANTERKYADLETALRGLAGGVNSPATKARLRALVDGENHG